MESLSKKQEKVEQKSIIVLENLTQQDLDQKAEQDAIKKAEEEAEKRKNLKNTALNYIRIRDDYYKIVYRPDKSGKLYKDLLRLSKTTITDDYTKGILKHINKYDDITLVHCLISFLVFNVTRIYLCIMPVEFFSC